jgi:hypothetical protein
MARIVSGSDVKNSQSRASVLLVGTDQTMQPTLKVKMVKAANDSRCFFIPGADQRGVSRALLPNDNQTSTPAAFKNRHNCW